LTAHDPGVGFFFARVVSILALALPQLRKLQTCKGMICCQTQGYSFPIRDPEVWQSECLPRETGFTSEGCLPSDPLRGFKRFAVRQVNVVAIVHLQTSTSQ
jgi:hypothetical protein